MALFIIALYVSYFIHSAPTLHSLYSKPNNRHVQLHWCYFSVVNNADSVCLLSDPCAVVFYALAAACHDDRLSVRQSE